MEQPASFLKALMLMMLPNESLTDFRKQFQALTPDDKVWFRKQFKAEYGWEWSD